MAEELMVFLNRSDNLGFGFSLLGTAGLPHVIYDIVENSPAALSGQVEAGDVIVKVNGTDVHRLTTKEVLKCLRLSDDPVTLQLKRDPKIKAQIRKYLAQTSNLHHSSDHHHLPNFDLDHNPTSQNHSSSSSSSTTSSSTSSPTKNRQNSGNLRAAANHHNQPRSDPICRPSRIPQAVKSPVHQSTSPNHQQSHQSHIPIFNSKSAPQSPPAAPQQQQSTSGTSNNLHHNQPHYIGLKQETSNSVESQRSTSKTNGGSGGGGVVGVSNSFNNKSNTVGSFIQSQQTQHQQQQPPTKARFEAYMMTGDLILNLSRTPQSSGLITTQHKKVDSLRNSPSHSVGRQQNGSIGPIAPHAKYDSSPSSSNSLSDDGGNGGVSDTGIIGLEQKNTSKTSKKLLKQQGIDGNYDDVQNVRMMEVDDNGGDSSSSLSNGKAVTANDVAARSDLSNKNTDQGCANTTNTRTLTTAVATNALPEDQTDNLANSRSSSSSTMRGAGDPMNSSPEMSFSVPTSPTSQSTPLIDDHSEATTGGAGDRYPLKKKESTSVPTSPDSGAQEFVRRTNGVSRTCDAAGFRTSRSEDHLQATQRDGLGAVIPIDIDEDVNSSLNTLLDTRHDSEDSPQGSDRDRIVWTYNAPVKQQSSDHSSHSSSINSSPQRTDSLASPTSVSSSVMSSNSSSKENSIDTNGPNLLCPLNGGVGGGVGGGMGGAGGGGGMDQSMSEAISNISSPDYQDDDNLLSSRDVAMAISDPSDSDSTILVSETPQHRKKMASQKTSENQYLTTNQGYAELKDSEDELATITDDQPTVLLGHDYRESSPPVSDDGSDVDSLHSFHYSPKAVDIPSAVRLAKRLYGLDGFKKSDVSRHLSKNNDFSRAVAEEYLKYFSFENSTLDEALRQFLQQFSLSGETQERERVLVHFSKRYLDCNPNCFNSQDAVHTLTCAIMLLNIDLHGQNIGRRMTCSEFIENLADLNDGDNFPKDTLKYLYQAIKANPLQWALDDEYTVPKKSEGAGDGSYSNQAIGNNPFLDAPQNPAAIEYKKGYVMRKCCYDSNNKKTPFGKRSWKMFYCTLRDLVLYLHKDEHGFRKNQMTDNVHNAIRIHHALATKANDYTKKQHVFRLQTSDQAEYLFQTSDSKELQSWIDTINFVCASFSAPPLEGGVGSQKRFQRPLLPSSHTKLLLTEQLSSHEQRMADLTAELEKHRYLTVPSKGLALQNYREKDSFLQYEIKRYKTYISVLKPKLDGDTGGDPNRHFLALQKANNDLLNSAAAIAGTTTGTVGSNSGSTARSPATSPTTPTVINNLTVAEETTTNVTSVASINQRENKNSNLQSSNRKSTRSKKDLKQKN